MAKKKKYDITVGLNTDFENAMQMAMGLQSIPKNMILISEVKTFTFEKVSVFSLQENEDEKMKRIKSLYCIDLKPPISCNKIIAEIEVLSLHKSLIVFTIVNRVSHKDSFGNLIGEILQIPQTFTVDPFSPKTKMITQIRFDRNWDCDAIMFSATPIDASATIRVRCFKEI